MNSDTGEIRFFKANEEIKPPWVPVNTPNPNCLTCGGKGTVLVDITKEYYPNRAARRRAHNEKVEKYLPCPDCAGKK